MSRNKWFLLAILICIAALGCRRPQTPSLAQPLPKVTLKQLALSTSGKVWWWGKTPWWWTTEPGAKRWEERPVITNPQCVIGLDNIVDVSAGYDHIVALRSDGSVWTWGGNIRGQLGLGLPDTAKSPRDVALRFIPRRRVIPAVVRGVRNVVRVAAGDWCTYVLCEDGYIWGWGLLPEGATSKRRFIARHPDAVDIAAGRRRLLVLNRDGSVWSHSGFEDDRVVDRVIAIDADFERCIALREDGTVLVWGEDMFEETADGTGPVWRDPSPVSGLRNIRAVRSAVFSYYALDDEGALWAWGRNASGQLGDATTTDRRTPVQVQNLPTDLISLAAGDVHALTLTASGQLWEWGNFGGVTVVGKPPNIGISPVRGPDLENVVSIAASSTQSVAIVARNAITGRETQEEKAE